MSLLNVSFDQTLIDSLGRNSYKKILKELNEITDERQLVRRVDGIGKKRAKVFFEKKKRLGGEFRNLRQILDVPGFSYKLLDSTIKDLIPSGRQAAFESSLELLSSRHEEEWQRFDDTSDYEANAILIFLDAIEVPAQLDLVVEDIGPVLADKILKKRKRLGGSFKNLLEVEEIEDLGPTRMANLANAAIEFAEGNLELPPLKEINQEAGCHASIVKITPDQDLKNTTQFVIATYEPKFTPADMQVDEIIWDYDNRTGAPLAYVDAKDRFAFQPYATGTLLLRLKIKGMVGQTPVECETSVLINILPAPPLTEKEKKELLCNVDIKHSTKTLRPGQTYTFKSINRIPDGDCDWLVEDPDKVLESYDKDECKLTVHVNHDAPKNKKFEITALNIARDFGCASKVKTVKIKGDPVEEGSEEEDANCSVKIIRCDRKRKGPVFIVPRNGKLILCADGKPKGRPYWKYHTSRRNRGISMRLNRDRSVTIRGKKPGTGTIIFVEWRAENGSKCYDWALIKVPKRSRPTDEDPDIWIDEDEEDVKIENVYAKNPDKAMDCLPQFMQVPFVNIQYPPATKKDKYLQKIYYEVTKTDVKKKTLEIKLKTGGETQDPFPELKRVRAEIDGPEGRHVEPFRSREYKDGGSFGKEDVPIKGLGLHIVQIVATNPIIREGSSYFLLHVGIKKRYLDEIQQIKRIMARVMRSDNPNPQSVRQAEMENLTKSLENTWAAALKNPGLTVRHVKKGAYDKRILDAWKYRIKVLQTEAGLAYIAFVQDVPSRIESPPHISFIEYKQGAALSFAPPGGPSGGRYFVTEPDYDGSASFQSKGLLRGNKQEEMQSKLNDVLEYRSQIFGVAVNGPDCQVLTEENKVIHLSAQGLPDPCRGRKGTYEWDVITAPKGAEWSFNPKGPTPVAATEFKPKKSGRYTVRVKFDVEEIKCPHVHDTLDIDVYFKQKVNIGIFRLGNYPASLAKHKTRPYLYERSQEVAQGAEIMIRPPFGDLGHEFEASLAFPEEITTEQSIMARVYTTPKMDEWVDFAGEPFIVFASSNKVAVKFDLADTIYGVQFYNIRYSDLMKLKGQAVKVDVAYRYPGHKCDGVEDLIPGGTFGSASSSAPSDLQDEEYEYRTLVNLLLFNRDLGETPGGRADIELDTDGSFQNIPNGNVHITVPVTHSVGHGINANLRLHYNSLHSSYCAALKDLMIHNNVSINEIRQHYDDWSLGPGWTHTYAMRIFPYVIPEGEENQLLHERLELVCSDGNRIYFQQRDSGNEFDPIYDTDRFDQDPDVALSLVIKRNGSGYILKDKYQNSWKFDKDGYLKEMGDLLTENSTTPALRVEGGGGTISIVDSSERKTKIGFKNGLIEAISDINNKKTDLDYKRIPISVPRHLEEPPRTLDLLEFISDPIRRTRNFGYEFENYFMTSKTNRRDVEVKFGYYTATSPPDTDPKVAAYFWGRLSLFSNGPRGYWVKYLAELPDNSGAPTNDYKFDPKSQIVQLQDGDNVLQYYDIDLKRLAASEHLIKMKDEDELKSLAKFVYRDKSKAVLSTTDHLNTSQYFAYSETIENARAFNLAAKINGEKFGTLYTYNKINRVETIGAGDSNVTTYKYDKMGNMINRKEPKVKVATSRSETANKSPETIWKYNPDGTLERIIDPRGFKTIFEYGGSGDPGKCKLPTTIRKETNSDGDEVEDTFVYDKAGNTKKISEGLSGAIYDRELDDGYRLEHETLKGIYVDGKKGKFKKTFEWNKHDMLKSVTDDMGRSESWEYNDYDEEEKHFLLQGGFTEVVEFSKTGKPIKVRDLTKQIKTYSYDQMGRLKKVEFPKGQGNNETLEPYTREYDDKKKTITEKQGHRTTTSTHDNTHRITEILFNEGDSLERKIIKKYGGGESPEEIEMRVGNGILRSIKYENDALGRLINITRYEDGNQYQTEMAYDVAGNLVFLKPESFSASPSGTPKVSHEYDGLNRRTKTYDSYDRLISRTEFDDVKHTVKSFRPLLSSVDSSTNTPFLELFSETKIDGRGNPITETTLGETVNYEHDGAGRMTRMIDSEGKLLVGKTYNNIDLLRSITTPATNFSETSDGQIRRDESTRTISYLYDIAGNLTDITHVGGHLHFKYDEMGRRISESQNSVERLSIAYDKLGRIKWVKDDNDNKSSFKYLEEDQKIETTLRSASGTEKRTYTLNESGQMESFSSSKSPVSLDFEHYSENILKSVDYNVDGKKFGGISYGLDGAGNREAKKVKIGRGTASTYYKYDANHRITEIDPPHGDTFEFGYNAAGFLVEMNHKGGGTKKSSEFRFSKTGEPEYVIHKYGMQNNEETHRYKEERKFDDNDRPRKKDITRTHKEYQEAIKTSTTSETLTHTKSGTLWLKRGKNKLTDGLEEEFVEELAFNHAGSIRSVKYENWYTVHPDIQVRHKRTTTTFKYYYNGNNTVRKIQQLVKAGDQIMYSSETKMKYDGNKRLSEKTEIRRYPKEARSSFPNILGLGVDAVEEWLSSGREEVKIKYEFEYDYFNRLKNVESTVTFDGETHKFKTSEYYYGPRGELLGEKRQYRNDDFKEYIEENDFTKNRPNPSYYITDHNEIETELSAEGKMFRYLTKLPGGGYPISGKVEKEVFYPFQDLDGSTAMVVDSNSDIRYGGPKFETPDASERVQVHASNHRMGDGALEQTWGNYMAQAFKSFPYMGENLPFEVMPKAPTDHSQFFDKEVELYVEKVLIGDAPFYLDFLHFIQFVVDLPEKIVDGMISTGAQRFEQFKEMGYGEFYATLATWSASVGDFLGYTDLLEGAFGVDLATSTSLSAGQQTWKIIIGAVSLATLIGGPTLNSLKMMKGAKPVSRIQRAALSVQRNWASWENVIRKANYLDDGLGVADLGYHAIGPTLDTENYMYGNSPKLGFVSRWYAKLGYAKKYVPKANTQRADFLQLITDLYHVGLAYGDKMTASGIKAGQFADSFVKARLLADNGKLLREIGIEPSHIHFEVSVNSGQRSIDVVWKKGKMAIELKRTVYTPFEPGGYKKAKQLQSHTEFLKGKGYWYGYVAGYVKGGPQLPPLNMAVANARGITEGVLEDSLIKFLGGPGQNGGPRRLAIVPGVF